MIQGVDEEAPVVIDIADKKTIEDEQYIEKNIIKSILLSMDNRIGEYSNVSTCYHNKMPTNQTTKDKYLNYINLISVLNGKEIDKLCHLVW
jgi:hypothetical protein